MFELCTDKVAAGGCGAVDGIDEVGFLDDRIFFDLVDYSIFERKDLAMS